MTSHSKKDKFAELADELKDNEFVDVNASIKFSDDPHFFKREITKANADDVYEIVSNAPREILHNKELMLLCCQKNAHCLKITPDDFRNDHDFLLSVLNNRRKSTDPSYPMDIINTYCSNELAFTGEEFFGKAVKANGFDFPYIPEAMKQNRYVVGEGASSEAYGCVWDNMDSNLKTDNHVLLTFYEKNPLFLYKQLFNKQGTLMSFYSFLENQNESLFLHALETMNVNKWDGDNKNNWYPNAVFQNIVDFTIEQVSEKSLRDIKKTIVSDYLNNRIDDRF